MRLLDAFGDLLWLTCLQPAQLCLTQGKTSTHLDLDIEADKQALKRLIEDADVILQGYRPEVFEKRGLGIDFAMEIAQRRGKGIVWLVSLSRNS
jgi:hypothetical protein